MNGDTFLFTMKGDDQLTRPLKQAQNQMKNLARETNNAKRQMTIFGNSVKDVRKFNMGALQQAGYQVGDYAVQVANGTSKMQAFGQQAPQFLQIFGPIGSVIGAVVAVLAAAGVAFEKSSEAAEKAAGKAKTFEDQMKSLEASVSKTNNAFVLSSGSLDTIRTKYGALTADLREFLKIQQELALNETSRQMTLAFDKLINTPAYMKVVGELGGIAEDIQQAEQDLAKGIKEELLDQDQINFARDEIALLREDYKALYDQIDQTPEGKIMALSEEFRNAAESKDFSAMKTAIVELRGQFAQLPLDARQALMPMIIQMEGQVRSFAVSMSGAKDIVDATAGSYDDILGSEDGLAASTEALNQVFEARLGTIDETANSYVDVLGSEKGLGAAVAANNALYLARKGLIDKTANEYVDVLGSESGLKSATEALNKLYEDRLKSLEKSAKLADPLGDLVERTKLNKDMLHVSDARRQVMEAIFQSERQYTPQQIEDTIKQVEAYNKQVKEMERIKSTADMIGSAFENAFMSMVDGTKSAKDAFKDLTRSIIADLYRQYVVKQITGFISNAIGGFMAGPVQGPNLPSGRVLSGGGYTGNGSRSGGLDGRGGFMAMLHPRETVIDHAKGQSAGGVVVNQTFQFSANGDDSVKQIIAQAAPTIAKMAQQGIIDARRRGGQVKQVFG